MLKILKIPASYLTAHTVIFLSQQHKNKLSTHRDIICYDCFMPLDFLPLFFKRIVFVYDWNCPYFLKCFKILL